MWIIVSGNPADGFDYFGPFKSYDEALKKAEDEFESEWWVCKLEQLK